MFEPPYVGSYEGQVVDQMVPIEDHHGLGTHQHVPINDQRVPIAT